MMRFLLRISAHFIFLLSGLFCNVILSEGFVADTLVGTPTGYTRIQDLSVDDAVTVYTFQTASASSRIVQSASNWGESIIRMGIDGEIIDMAEDQLLFIPLQRAWLPASAIREGMYLLGSPLRAVRVQSVEKIEQATCVYALSLNHNHTYLVGKHGILVHNFGELVFTVAEAAESVTLLNVFLAANPLVAPVTIAVGGAGLFGYLIWTFIDAFKDFKKSSNDKDKNNNKSNESASNKENSSNGGRGSGDDDPNNSKKDVTRIIGNQILDWADFEKLDRFKQNTTPFKESKGAFKITGHFPELPKNARYLSPDKLHRGEVEVWASPKNHLGAWVIDVATQML